MHKLDSRWYNIYKVKFKEKSMIKLNEQAPDFRLESSLGGEVSLSDFRGRKVVLYFYPKDNTPG